MPFCSNVPQDTPDAALPAVKECLSQERYKVIADRTAARLLWAANGINPIQSTFDFPALNKIFPTTEMFRKIHDDFKTLVCKFIFLFLSIDFFFGFFFFLYLFVCLSLFFCVGWTDGRTDGCYQIYYLPALWSIKITTLELGLVKKMFCFKSSHASKLFHLKTKNGDYLFKLTTK